MRDLTTCHSLFLFNSSSYYVPYLSHAYISNHRKLTTNPPPLHPEKKQHLQFQPPIHTDLTNLSPLYTNTPHSPSPPHRDLDRSHKSRHFFFPFSSPPSPSL